MMRDRLRDLHALPDGFNPLEIGSTLQINKNGSGNNEPDHGFNPLEIGSTLQISTGSGSAATGAAGFNPLEIGSTLQIP